MEPRPEPASEPVRVTETLPEYGPLRQVVPSQAMSLDGAVLSTRICRPAVVATLPAVSTARTWTVAVPSATWVESQESVYGAALTVPTTLPLTRKSTWSTPESSLAEATRLVAPC